MLDWIFTGLLASALSTPTPLVIGHRGANGLLPEHTLEAYQLAISQGADYIEPDLVMTKDGHLIARHENEIGGTTDVAQKFPGRKRIKMIDGHKMTGWFTEDFTLAEIKQLKAKQRLDFRDQSYNGKYSIPTLNEILKMVTTHNQKATQKVGLYIETKHPSYFKSIQQPLEGPLLKALSNFGLNHQSAKVFIQSFEISNLKTLNAWTDLKLVQLIDSEAAPYDQVLAKNKLSYADMITPSGLEKIAQYADGIGPYKRLIVPEKNGKLQPPTDLIPNAHKARLVVHPWTFRSDDYYLHKSYQGQPEKEYIQFFKLGVDGVFSDFTHDAFRAREKWLKHAL